MKLRNSKRLEWGASRPRCLSDLRMLPRDRRWWDLVIRRAWSRSEFDYTLGTKKEFRRLKIVENVIDEIEFAAKSVRSRLSEWFPSTGIVPCQHRHGLYKRRLETLISKIKHTLNLCYYFQSVLFLCSCVDILCLRTSTSTRTNKYFLYFSYHKLCMYLYFNF